MTTTLNHHLRIEPYDYQREGILYGLQHRRLIIGDEPGLGKTLQSIGIVDTAPAYPCLVICPSSLKINWQREFEKFTDKQALVLDNSNRTTWPYLLRMSMYRFRGRRFRQGEFRTANSVKDILSSVKLVTALPS